MSDVLANLLSQKSQMNALLDGILTPGTFSYQAGDGSVLVGKFNLDYRLDSCFIASGFLEANGIEFQRKITHTQPRLVDTDLRFEAVGTIRLTVKLAGSDCEWDMDFMIMDYPSLKVFDDKNPKSSKSGFFQIGLGGCFVDEYFSESRRDAVPSSAGVGGDEKRIWRVALPNLPFRSYSFAPAQDLFRF